MPASLPQLQKAYLEVETGARIECMFNPATFAFSQANRWESDQVPGKSTPTMRFAGGEGGSFSLSLVFDTTAAGTAVTAYTNKLLKLMDVDTTLAGYDADAQQRPAAVGQVPLGHVAALVQGGRSRASRSRSPTSRARACRCGPTST